MDKLFLIGAFLLTLASIAKFVTITKWKTAEIFLSIALLTLLFINVILYIRFHDHYILLAYFYRWGTLAAFIFIPSCFLYLKYSLTGDKLKKIDLLLFIPSIVFLIDYLPFFVHPISVKYKIMMTDLANQTGYLHLQSRWMPFGIYFILQNTMGVILSIYMLYLVPFYIKMGGKSFYLENKLLVFWNILLSFFLLITCLPDFIFSVSGYQFDLQSITYITPCLFLYISLPISILLSPSILKGSKGFWMRKIYALKPAHVFTISENLNKEELVNDILAHSQNLLKERKENDLISNKFPIPGFLSERTYIDAQRAAALKKTLDHVMHESKLYLKPDLTITDLAEASNCSEHQLKYLLSEYEHISFEAYKNSFK